MLVLAYYGLRWGELAGLTVADVDVAKGRLEVRHTMVEVNGYMEPSRPKSYEERSVPVSRSVMARIAPLVAGAASDRPLFQGVRSGWPPQPVVPPLLV